MQITFKLKIKKNARDVKRHNQKICKRQNKIL